MWWRGGLRPLRRDPPSLIGLFAQRPAESPTSCFQLGEAEAGGTPVPHRTPPPRDTCSSGHWGFPPTEPHQPSEPTGQSPLRAAPPVPRDGSARGCRRQLGDIGAPVMGAWGLHCRLTSPPPARVYAPLITPRDTHLPWGASLPAVHTGKGAEPPGPGWSDKPWGYTVLGDRGRHCLSPRPMPQPGLPSRGAHSLPEFRGPPAASAPCPPVRTVGSGLSGRGPAHRLPGDSAAAHLSRKVSG